MPQEQIEETRNANTQRTMIIIILFAPKHHEK